MLLILLHLLCNFANAQPIIANVSSRIEEAMANATMSETVKDPKRFPYQATLLYKDNHTCDGAIVSETYILTTAYCCTFKSEGKDVKPTHVVVGRLQRNTSTEHSLIRKVLEVIVHRKYSTSAHTKYDIAALRITTLGKLTLYVNKIDISTQTPHDAAKCVFSGWAPNNTNLQSIALTILPQRYCNATYRGDVCREKICAMQSGFNFEYYRSCYGGPLICMGKLAGLLSFDDPCAGPGYVNVAYYRFWIMKAQRIYQYYNHDNRNIYNNTTTTTTDIVKLGAGCRIIAHGYIISASLFAYFIYVILFQ